MKWVYILIALLLLLLAPSCQPSQQPENHTIDWSKIDTPRVAEEGDPFNESSVSRYCRWKI